MAFRTSVLSSTDSDLFSRVYTRSWSRVAPARIGKTGWDEEAQAEGVIHDLRMIVHELWNGRRRFASISGRRC
jgi:hypothetical protein